MEKRIDEIGDNTDFTKVIAQGFPAKPSAISPRGPRMKRSGSRWRKGKRGENYVSRHSRRVCKVSIAVRHEKSRPRSEVKREL